MLSGTDSILLGIVQGLTEFLPISSSGHLIIARELLGIDQIGGLAFDAILQLATALAVVLYFRRDIWDLTSNLFKKNRDAAKLKLAWALIMGTIPALIIGLFLQDYMETLFRSPALVAITLIIGAGIMYLADMFLENRAGQSDVVTAKRSIAIGFFQSLALIPGMSRSGMTISGGYFLGLTKEMAVRFSFLLSIPIIVGSGLIKLVDIVRDPLLTSSQINSLVLGAVSAFVCGWFAIDFLLKFLKTNTFTVFVIYRLLLAIVILLLFI